MFQNIGQKFLQTSDCHKIHTTVYAAILISKP